MLSVSWAKKPRCRSSVVMADLPEPARPVMRIRIVLVYSFLLGGGFFAL